MRELQRIVNQIQSLPTLPQVAQHVIALVENPDTSSSSLAKAIGSDAALVSKILRIVNSAYYGLPRKITTVSQATVILGFNTVKNLVITTSVFSAFNNDLKNHRFDRKKFWEHSLGCAVASKVLSKRIRMGLPEEAFVAGLIHDVGKIVLDQYFHKDFEAVLTLVETEQISIVAAENKILGIDHTKIGEWLCDKWNFPIHIQESVVYHHSPLLTQHNRKMVAIVHLADAIARIEGLGFSGDQQPPSIEPQSWEMINIPEEELGELVEEIKEEFEKTTVFLELT